MGRAILVRRMPSEGRSAGAGSRPAETMASLDSTMTPRLALAAPDKRRGLAVPAPRGRLQPGDNLGGRLGMLAGQGPPPEDALDRFRHVQPRAAQRGVQGHDPVREEPEDEGDAQVPGQVVQDEQQPQGRQDRGQRDPDREPRLPALPAPVVVDGDGAAGGAGNVARMLRSSACSQGWSTALGACVTPLTRTSPVRGWNSVNCLAVPTRTYS